MEANKNPKGAKRLQLNKLGKLSFSFSHFINKSFIAYKKFFALIRFENFAKLPPIAVFTRKFLTSHEKAVFISQFQVFGKKLQMFIYGAAFFLLSYGNKTLKG